VAPGHRGGYAGPVAAADRLAGGARVGLLAPALGGAAGPLVYEPVADLLFGKAGLGG
jgi:hypothetical protein